MCAHFETAIESDNRCHIFRPSQNNRCIEEIKYTYVKMKTYLNCEKIYKADSAGFKMSEKLPLKSTIIKLIGNAVPLL